MHQVDAPPSEDPSSSIIEPLDGTSELKSKQREQMLHVCLHRSENSQNNEDCCSGTSREEHNTEHEIDTEENKHVDTFVPQQHAIDDKINADEDERVDAFTLH
jgi:hypothetical protein